MSGKKLRNDPGFAIYMQELTAVPRLSREEETELALQAVRARRGFHRTVLASGWAWPLALRVARGIRRGKRGFGRSLRGVGDPAAARREALRQMPGLMATLSQSAAETRRTFVALCEASTDARDVARRDGARRAHFAARRRTVRCFEQLRLRTRVVREILFSLEKLVAAARGRADEAAGNSARSSKPTRSKGRAFSQGLEPIARLERRCRQAHERLSAYRLATRKLASANLPLVISIARDYRYAGASFSDLVQDGNTGLMRAAEKFDPRHGAPFAPYAAAWVRQAINARAGRQARREARVISIDAENPNEPGRTIANRLSDPSALHPVDAIMQSALRERLDQLLQTLSDRERQVLRQRFGLEGRRQSYQQIAVRMRITYQRVRQIERGALAKLRVLPKVRLLKEFAP